MFWINNNNNKFNCVKCEQLVMKKFQRYFIFSEFEIYCILFETRKAYYYMILIIDLYYLLYYYYYIIYYFSQNKCRMYKNKILKIDIQDVLLKWSMQFSLKLLIFERNIFDTNGNCPVLKENISIITNLILNVFQISIFVFPFYGIVCIAIFIFSYVLNSCFFKTKRF